MGIQRGAGGGGKMVHVLGGRGLVWGFREGRGGGGGKMVHVLGGRGLVWGFREGWEGGWSMF